MFVAFSQKLISKINVNQEYINYIINQLFIVFNTIIINHMYLCSAVTV